MLLSRSSKVYAHALCKRSGSLYKKNANFDLKLFSTSNASDRDLLLEYTTMSSFTSKLWNLMFDSEERNKYYELQQSGVLPSDSYFSPVWTYLCLKNPLLQRYNIEGADLIEGAQYSYEAITKALSSKDFYDHLRGDVEQSDSNDFLASVQSPEVYNAWRVSTKQFDDTGMRFSLKKLEIQKVALRNIVTKIVPGDVPEGTEFLTDLERAVYMEFTGTKAKNNTKTPAAVDTLEPPATAQPTSSSTDKSAVSSAQTSVTSTAASSSSGMDTTQTPSTSTAALAASLLKQAATTATPTSSATPSTVTAATSPAPPSSTASASSEGFKVQPATRRTNRAVIAVRTGDESNPNTTVPEVTHSDRDPTSSVTNGEHPHVPPITAEGTPVKADDHASADTPEEAETPPEEKVVQKTGYARDFELFPPGAVLAYVDVQYKVLEESEIVVHSKPDDGEQTSVTIPQKKVRDVTWSFRGCISGQVPLEWTLVDINGPRAMSFKV